MPRRPGYSESTCDACVHRKQDLSKSHQCPNTLKPQLTQTLHPHTPDAAGKGHGPGRICQPLRLELLSGADEAPTEAMGPTPQEQKTLEDLWWYVRRQGGVLTSFRIAEFCQKFPVHRGKHFKQLCKSSSDFIVVDRIDGGYTIRLVWAEEDGDV